MTETVSYKWFGNFLFRGDVCVGEIYRTSPTSWAWLLYSDRKDGLPEEELGGAATEKAAAAALEAVDRLRRHPAGVPATEGIRGSVASHEGAVRPDGGVAAQPSSVEPGASLLAEGVGQRRPVEGDRQPGPAGAPPAPAAQPLPATSGGDSAPASVPPTDPSRASARSPEVVGSETIPEARWVPVGEWYAQPAPSGGEGDCWQELIDSLPSNHPLRPACEARRLLGIERYGQPLRRGDGRSAVQDLRDELLDAAAYAWRLGYEDLALELLETAQSWVGMPERAS